MPKFYFTFGSGQVDTEQRTLFYRFCVIEAPDEVEARRTMHKARGFRWSMCYTEQEFEGQAETYGLTEIHVSDVALPEEAH